MLSFFQELSYLYTVMLIHNLSLAPTFSKKKPDAVSSGQCHLLKHSIHEDDWELL